MFGSRLSSSTLLIAALCCSSLALAGPVIQTATGSGLLGCALATLGLLALIRFTPPAHARLFHARGAFARPPRLAARYQAPRRRQTALRSLLPRLGRRRC